MCRMTIIVKCKQDLNRRMKKFSVDYKNVNNLTGLQESENTQQCMFYLNDIKK